MIEIAKSLIVKNKKYLLIKRSSDSKFFPNLWDLPGGKIEPGEEAEKAVIRETAEETSLTITVGKKIGDFNYTEQGSPIHFQIFPAKTSEGVIKLSEDHTDFIWLAEQNFDKYDLTPIVKLFFNLT